MTPDDPSVDAAPPDDPLAPTAPAPGAVPSGDGTGPEAPAPSDLSVESLLEDFDRLTRERDDYLDTLRRTQADFENYRKRMMKQQADQSEVVAARLVEELLPVLDACDSAIQHGTSEVEPIFAALLGALEKHGLERIDPGGEEFDPNRHEAVMHEPAADGDEGTVVADVMRRGYAWKGRVLRAAMVKVRG